MTSDLRELCRRSLGESIVTEKKNSMGEIRHRLNTPEELVN